jgi:hypothetical protein
VLYCYKKERSTPGDNDSADLYTAVMKTPDGKHIITIKVMKCSNAIKHNIYEDNQNTYLEIRTKIKKEPEEFKLCYICMNCPAEKRILDDIKEAGATKTTLVWKEVRLSNRSCLF